MEGRTRHVPRQCIRFIMVTRELDKLKTAGLPQECKQYRIPRTLPDQRDAKVPFKVVAVASKTPDASL